MLSYYLRRISVCFAGGCMGALIYAWLVWYLGHSGIHQRLGVKIAPGWTLQSLYLLLVWGGLWGLVFMLPIWRKGFWSAVFSRGILLSLFPTAFILFYLFPVLLGKGFMGLTLGKLTPLVVFVYNACWGFFAALWIYSAE